MSLPLEQVAKEDGLCFLLTPKNRGDSLPGLLSQPRIPQSPPGPGEQYRFHLDMAKCIGCRCCEVACNEQNNNPAGIHWRRVGEIEGGSYPFVQRLYLSMGCNHCLEPSCLAGCPVDAYSKDPQTGIVLHIADACIGCQYCTWNCPYGVPQYNPERGVVGKCDMCYGRLAEGREPACVDACPEGAIRIETVNIDDWKQQFEQHGNAPGLPSAEHTVSTTRITLPKNLTAQLQKADAHRVRPEHPHWPLVFMTVLTQLSVGAFSALAILGRLGHPSALRLASATSLGIGLLSLGASTFHLGRPAYAYRALKMWRRSWLSREVLLFSAFACAASLYAGLLWLGGSGTFWAGSVTSLLGMAGVTASARIYMVPARPAWNSKYTLADFYLTTASLGTLFIAALLGIATALFYVAAAGGAGILLNQGLRFLWLARSDEFELRGSARLLSQQLRPLLLTEMALLGAGSILLPLLGHAVGGFLAALAGVFAGRYLFYVSVVPMNMAASFFARERDVA